MKRPIYLDYHATTPVDPRVVEKMVPFFGETFGNAASRNHNFGWAAAEAVETARARVARLIGAHHKDIVFTSGATESNNLALKGVVAAHRGSGAHVITVATEHHSVLDTCRFLQDTGVEVTILPVDSDGLIDPSRLEAAITARTRLISVMAANNEIGVIQPLAEIGRIARDRGIAFHTDASQVVGRTAFDVGAIQADLVSYTAHKLYGPKGIGALFVRRKGRPLTLSPLMHGGGQERGLRAGTLNVPGIVGFGEAAEICRQEMIAEGCRVESLRNRLLERLRTALPDVRVNGSLRHRLAHNLNVAFPGADPEPLRMGIDDVAVSFGSACSTGRSEPSHVLKALGMPDDLAMASIRFGLGRWTTAEEVDYAAAKVAGVVEGQRRMVARA
jgi:cysteine desulfurase